MDKGQQLKEQISNLIKESGVSQSELAKSLEFTASRLSRLLSGEISISPEDAKDISRALGTERATSYAEYLDWEWQQLPQPSFEHPNLADLWEAERALQELHDLASDPNAKNAFVQQVNSCGDALKKYSEWLGTTRHEIIFVGSPGVGKTTAICGMADLRDHSQEALEKQMAFQTGSGRNTVGEVRVRHGGEYSIKVTPCSREDLQQYVTEFTDQILIAAGLAEKPAEESVRNSTEIERMLRNMTGLKKQREKVGGKLKTRDLAVERAKLMSREDFVVDVWSRLELGKRQRDSVSLSKDSTESGMAWLSRTSRRINLGNHPDFSVPAKIEITIPDRVLDCDEFDISLVDTRGIDEPSAPRRDLQGYIDDERSILVLCSEFNSAPDAAVQALIERAVASGSRSGLLDRGSLLVVTKNGVDQKVNDYETGQSVETAEEGRAIREEEIGSTLSEFAISDIPVHFLDVTNDDDCSLSRQATLRLVTDLREKWSAQMRQLVKTVRHLIENKEDNELRAVFEAALNPIKKWLANNDEIAEGEGNFAVGLLSGISGVHASSLRASVNRRGRWYSFDYWQALGTGTRQSVVARTKEQRGGLELLLKNEIEDPEHENVKDFLQHFESQAQDEFQEFFIWVSNVGESAYVDQLSKDDSYWHQAQGRWGLGSGYKDDIRHWTRAWFSEEDRRERNAFIEEEIKVRWRHLVERLLDKLGSDIPVS